MNYLIVEILGCLVIAGIIGMVLGWFLRGGCRKKLKHNTLDWQEKLRIDNLAAKNKISLLEEKFLDQLQAKDDEYKLKINRILSNQKENNKEEVSKNELSLLNHAKSNRIHQENIFLKGELDRSVSELNNCEKSLNMQNKKILILEKQLLLNNRNWKRKLQERELSWVDKVASLDEASSVDKTEVDNSKITVKKMEESLADCEKKLKEKENASLKLPTDKIKSTQPQKDNLKIIRGIGAIIEENLNTLGIDTFAQIASWSEQDVLDIDKRFSLKGKIKREKWIEQAVKIINAQ